MLSYTCYWKISISFDYIICTDWCPECLIFNVNVFGWPPNNCTWKWAWWNVGLHIVGFSTYVCDKQSMEPHLDVWLFYPAPWWWSTSSKHDRTDLFWWRPDVISSWMRLLYEMSWGMLLALTIPRKQFVTVFGREVFGLGDHASAFPWPNFTNRRVCSRQKITSTGLITNGSVESRYLLYWLYRSTCSTVYKTWRAISRCQHLRIWPLYGGLRSSGLTNKTMFLR